MTTEGVFIIEEAGPPDTTVQNHLSLFHVARAGYDTLPKKHTHERYTCTA